MRLPHVDFMIDAAKNTTADFAASLLIHYSFDLGGYPAKELIAVWLNNYSASWVRCAVIEALYQGRYKAVSVEQILAFWQRRGLALYHFNHEFERLVCGMPSKGGYSPNNPTEQEQAIFPNNQADLIVTTSDVEATNVTANIPPAVKPGAKITQRHHSVSANKQKLPPSTANQPPIEHFTPEADDIGDFYSKLKAIAQHSEDAQPSN